MTNDEIKAALANPELAKWMLTRLTDDMSNMVSAFLRIAGAPDETNDYAHALATATVTGAIMSYARFLTNVVSEDHMLEAGESALRCDRILDTMYADVIPYKDPLEKSSSADAIDVKP